MKYKTIICTLTESVDPEDLKAFEEAIKDPELRKKIISILEEAGLLPASRRRLA